MLMFAGFLTVVVLVAVALIFVMTRQATAAEVVPANEFSCWDDDLRAVRKMSELAARCRAARGVRK
ncbi:MAG TPA: hypothetical protein DCF88_08020 [Plesiomonas shigelloides]|nr:hypothetical protein [Plesiomonas shigelloides]